MEEKDKKKEKKKARKSRIRNLVVLILCLFLIFLLIAPHIFVVVPAGHGGVLFKTLGKGTVTKKVYNEGLHFKLPWDVLTLYNARKQIETRKINALSKDGLRIESSVSVRFRVDYDSLGVLHKNVGPNYINLSIVPEVESAIRNVMAQYGPNSIYSSHRDSIEDIIVAQTKDEIQKIDVYVIDVLIESISLPDEVEEAIDQKLVQKQKNLEYTYRLAKEQKEAERKLIEAKGIKAFTDSSGISILNWKGIEATQDIAKSENSKIVIIGNDSESLPVILNADK